MPPYMVADPDRLVMTVNGREYNGSSQGANTLVLVDPVDVPILTANGWTAADPLGDAEVDGFAALAGSLTLLSTDVSALQTEDNLPKTGVPLPQANGAAGNISWNMAQSTKGLVDLGANANVVVPTNIPSGGRAVLIITQNTGSNWPVTWNSAFKFGSAGNSSVTQTNGATDIFEFECDTTRLLCVAASKNVA